MFEQWKDIEPVTIVYSDSKQHEEAVNLQNAFIEVFKSQAGQRVFDNIMKISGAYKNGFDTDPAKMAYNEGARSVAQHIEIMLKGNMLLQTRNENND